MEGAPPVESPEQLHQAVEGSTIPRLLRRNARQFADLPALTTGIGPDDGTLTWFQLRAEVAAVTRGLTAVGLNRGERVLIAMSQRAEHWVTALAAIHLGALPCSTYDTLDTEQIRSVARHSAATVLVVEGEEQLRRWQPALDDLPHLRAVVLLDWGAAPEGDARFVSYPAVRGAGPLDDAAFDALTDGVTTDQPLSVVYTPGTTGGPKGVVLTHRNVIHQSLMHDRPAAVPRHARTVAQLPVAHVAGQVLGIHLPVCDAGQVTLCADPARLLPTLLRVRPHGFFGTPRVWERLATGLRQRLDTLTGERAETVAHARRLALEAFRLRSGGKDVPEDLAARLERLDEQVLRPIRAAIGFDDCHRARSGAAPLPTAVQETLASVGLPVHEVWGLSETTGAVTVGTPEAFTPGACGLPGPGIEVRTAGDGELLVRGPVVAPGYLRADGGIEPATDADGWLPTGDTGSVDARGVVSVTGRKKDLVVTDGGERIAPARIESLLRSHPLVAHAVAIGDRRPYVTALLVLDEEAAPLWAKARGLGDGGLEELARRPEVLAALDTAVEEANAALSRPEQVRKYRVLAGPWTAESGELTPVLGVRREAVGRLHAATVESMYAQGPS
ncbi:Long-chain-fatty-acid--CoA ligase FadD15 [Streptomyces sp. enrichment culture]